LPTYHSSLIIYSLDAEKHRLKPRGKEDEDEEDDGNDYDLIKICRK
jgi:hypothetical protein